MDVQLGLGLVARVARHESYLDELMLTLNAPGLRVLKELSPCFGELACHNRRAHDHDHYAPVAISCGT